MGNGLAVWDSNKEANGDYLTVAHIRANRDIKLYVDLEPEYVLQIVGEALVRNTNCGEDCKVFDTDWEKTPKNIALRHLMDNWNSPEAMLKPIVQEDILENIAEDYARAWGATGIDFKEWWRVNNDSY